MDYKIGDKVRMNGNFKLYQPFFIDTQLCVITKIRCLFLHNNGDCHDYKRIDYSYDIVHTYAKNEFVPGLTAESELEKYSKTNKDRELSKCNERISNIESELSEINERITQPKQGWTNRMKSFYNDAASYGLSDPCKHNLDYEYQKRIDEWKSELASKIKLQDKYINKRNEIMNSVVVCEKFNEEYPTYYWEKLDEDFVKLSRLFTTSNDVLKCNLGVNYYMDSFDYFTFFESEEIKHLPDELVYFSGGVKRYLSGIRIEYVNSILENLNKYEFNYYINNGPGCPLQYITEDEFEYSDKIVKLLETV